MEITSVEKALEAVKEDVWQFPDIPEQFKTLEVCLAAVQHNGEALRFVPEKLKTADLCLTAMLQTGRAFDAVPKKFHTEKLIRTAIENDISGIVLDTLSEDLITPELCLIAIQQNPASLEYVPEHLKTPELCFIAVKSYGGALEYVPEELKTAELCLAAIQNDEEGALPLEYVPWELRTLELCRAVAVAYRENDFDIDIDYDEIPEELHDEVRRIMEEAPDAAAQTKAEKASSGATEKTRKQSSAESKITGKKVRQRPASKPKATVYAFCGVTMSRTLEIGIFSEEFDLAIGQIKGIEIKDTNDINFIDIFHETSELDYKSIYHSFIALSECTIEQVTIKNEGEVEFDDSPSLDIEQERDIKKLKRCVFYWGGENANNHEKLFTLDKELVSYIGYMKNKTYWVARLENFEGKFDKRKLSAIVNNPPTRHIQKELWPYGGEFITAMYYDNRKMDIEFESSRNVWDDVQYFDKGWNSGTPILYLEESPDILE